MSIKTVWLPVLSLLAVSCGGGGGSTVKPVTQYRANSPGDTWSFNVKIDFGVFGTFPGSLDQSISNDTYNGSPSIKSTQVFTIQRPTGPSTLTSYAEFDTTGKLLAETINGTLLAVTSDTFSLPGTIEAGFSTGGTVTFSDGFTIAYKYRVLGAAAVSTPYGPFSCWVVSESDTQSSGTTDSFEQWVAPETGNYVVLKDTTKNTDGTGYTYIASLTAMSTAPVTPIPGLRGQMTRLIGAALPGK